MINVLQLSDTHLFANKEATLFDVNTYSALEQLLVAVQSRLDNIDIILLTGDVSQDMTEKSYQNIVELLDSFGKPVYWLAGNHDNKEMMEQVFNQYSIFHKLDCLKIGNWGFFMLDTIRPGEDKGYLQVETLARNFPKVHYLACVMHHHPIEVDTPLIDKYKLQNTKVLLPFFQGQDVYPKLIMTGHVHGYYKKMLDVIPIINAPATCFQFRATTAVKDIEPSSGCIFWQFNDDGNFKYEPFFC